MEPGTGRSGGDRQPEHEFVVGLPLLAQSHLEQGDTLLHAALAVRVALLDIAQPPV